MGNPIPYPYPGVRRLTSGVEDMTESMVTLTPRHRVELVTARKGKSQSRRTESNRHLSSTLDSTWTSVQVVRVYRDRISSELTHEVPVVFVVPLLGSKRGY